VQERDKRNHQKYCERDGDYLKPDPEKEGDHVF
jgi:hypothetical protein